MTGTHRLWCMSGLILLAGSWADPLTAQSLTHGTLAGTVLRARGPESTAVRSPLSEVMVWVENATTGVTWSVQTERDGVFVLSLLPPGRYNVLVEGLGYQPRRIEQVRVRAGSRTELEAGLEPARPPVDEVQVVQGNRIFPPSRPGAVQGFTARVLESLPESHREATEVARLFSESMAELETEGLPARHTALVVDGVPSSPAWHPDLPSGWLGGVGFPLSSFSELELVTQGTDVELSGWPGAYLTGVTRPGTSEFSTRALGTWGSDALAWSDHFDPGALPHTAVQGGLVMSGPIVKDTASFVVGIEARRLESVVPRAWLPTSMDEDFLRIARDELGVDLQAYAEPRLVRSQAITGTGRFDWQIGRRSALQVRGNLAVVPSADPDPVAPWVGPGSSLEARDLGGAATLTTEFDSRWAMEVRLAYESSLREYGLDEESAVPDTRLVMGGFAVGAGTGFPGRFEHAALRLGQAVHVRGERHHLKAGFGAVWSSYDHTYAYGRGGEFLFADPAALEAGRGAFSQTVGPLPVATFDVPRYGLFLQDQWRAAPGLEITAGVRYDLEEWPADRVRPNELWLERTGIDNTTIPDLQGQISPRLALSWDIQEQQRWRVDLAAGIHYQAADPAVLAELLTHDGRVEVRRGVGDLGVWPGPPSASAAPVMGPRLTVLGPDFVAPRTSRATASLTHNLDAGTAIRLSATARRTEFLPRRTDLNLLPVTAAEDQHGRPIYGALVKDGGLLVAGPGTNRRFGDFDLVSAVTADGESDYRGLTLSVDRWSAGALGLFGSYTFSRTTDDWLAPRGGGPESQLRPFPGGPDVADWSSGRSDLDLPHRLVLAGELRVPSPLRPRIAAVYRYRSGYPFTPGFRAGVDINGDGSGSNDPAFVDESIAGVSELIAEWDCLRTGSGGFAERNACREPGVHALDLRLALQVVRSGRYTAELIVDGLNLVESALGVYDHALYLIDPDADLVADSGTGVVTVPLVANPGFGELLARHSTGRTLRLGFRLAY